MLNAVEPLSLVAGAIGPVHLSVAVPLIIFVAASVDVARLPGEGAKPRLLIILVFPFILITVLCCGSLPPLALSMLHTVTELPNVDRGVFPLVLTEAMRFAVNVLTSVNIPIGEHV